MKDISMNDATILMENNLFIYDFDNNQLLSKEDMEKFNHITIFSEYVHRHVQRCGYQGDITDSSQVVSFIVSKCKEASVDISRQTITNWLTKGLPANTPNARENVYRLCFALQMDALQCKEFFLKAYLERPFNYKNIHEAVYFFCLNHGLSYSDAIRIIDKVESSPMSDNPYTDNMTEIIGEQLSVLETEEQLVKYISDNRSGFSIQNKTAVEKIKDLVKTCKITASEYENRDIENIDELLSAIYGYAARETRNGKLALKNSISKSNFPELIKRNWPQREQFKNILDKGTASYDVIRRALIMLTFYDFTVNATLNDAIEDGIFDEFVDEMNTVLSECGYVQLYWRNPFDWIIGYCAQSPDPITTLQDLIEEYYLSTLDE